jgi:transcription antitermination factor NusG
MGSVGAMGSKIVQEYSRSEPGAVLGCIGSCWYAFKVRTGGELRLRTSLERKGFRIFLPTYLEVRKYSDRLKNVDAPLYPGYLFSRLDAADRLPILATPGVESVVSIGGVPQPVDDSEIEGILRVVDSGSCALPWPFLRVGDRVRIVHGPLSGVEGFLVRARNKDRLVISCNLLQRSISVEMDRTYIKPIPAA